MRSFFLLTVIIFIGINNVFGINNTDKKQLQTQPPTTKLKSTYYTYLDRKHSLKESRSTIGIIYGLTWMIYPLTQFDTIKKHGSFSKYRDNFGKLVFDNDNPIWNWFIHPLSGSQLFLTYRAIGYSRINAMTMSIISSTLFEFTVEIYTEPASVQDLYQTPVLGSVLGVIFEKVSLYLLNSGNSFGKFFGHFLNPATLFKFYEGKIQFTPVIKKNTTAFLLTITF